MKRLENKVAIITGGASGIGRASACLFAKEGAKVVIADLDGKKGIETVKDIEKNNGVAMFVMTDVTKSADIKNLIQKTVEKYEKLNIMFNNAGIQGPMALTADLDENYFDKTIEINLKGVWLGMKYAIPEMLKIGGGSIINTASMCATVGMRGISDYSASKGGIVAASRVTAVEYVKNNIRVNCINPGSIETELVMELRVRDPETVKRLEAAMPRGCLGKPEDIAQMALFLASDESSNVTGAIFAVDGAVTAHCPVQLN